MDLLIKLKKMHGGEIILDQTDFVETDQYFLCKEGKRPFFKVKQDLEKM
jgi:hypothetical protein